MKHTSVRQSTTILDPYPPSLLDMADYWISQPRHFCEICKCWFGENKASIDFHESGKRHQENAKRHLRESRQKTAEKEKEKTETERALAAMERAALKAYQKDLEVQAGLPLSQDAVLPLPEQQPGLTVAESRPQPQKPPPQEWYTSKMQQLKPKATPVTTAAVATPTSTTDDITATPPPPPPPSQWQQLSTPEGHVYYYNILTGVSQWEPPAELQPQTAEGPSNPATISPTEGSGEAGQKRTAEEAGLEQSESRKSPRRVANPYGAWTTVAISYQEETGGGDSDGEGGDGGESSSEDKKDDRIQFEEKTLPTTEQEVTSGAFKGFNFKKRTGGAQKRPQIRQRTSEL